MSADAVRLTFPQSRSRLRAPSFSRRRSGESLRPVAAQPLELAALLAPGRWTPGRHVDPELRKALGVIQTRLSETRRLLGLPASNGTAGNDAALRELESLVERDPTTLDIDGAWELSGALKRLNLRLGDKEFLTSRLEYEQRRASAAKQWHGWNIHFDGDELVRLVDTFRRRVATAADQSRAIDRLTFLYLQREEAGRDRRARAALKRLYLSRLWIVLLVLLAGFGVAINVATNWTIWEAVVLTVCAGGLGSALSGVFKVRDQLVQLDELRSFWPAMRIQPLIGASGGLILFLVLQSHVVSLGAVSNGFSGRGLIAFAAGFSEPFFIGIVQRVAVVPDKATGPAEAKTS
jgi:hypothetical protein